MKLYISRIRWFHVLIYVENFKKFFKMWAMSLVFVYKINSRFSLSLSCYCKLLTFTWKIFVSFFLVSNWKAFIINRLIDLNCLLIFKVRFIRKIELQLTGKLNQDCLFVLNKSNGSLSVFKSLQPIERQQIRVAN